MTDSSLGGMLRQAADNLARRPYSRRFFSVLAPGSRASAEAVVPLILDLLEVNSVVDLGCGVGTWLSVFHAHGVADVLGIDGDWVPRERLEIAEERFRAADLSHPPQIGRRFDLAVSLEVAEHLPPSASDQLVATLVGLAGVVLFSAAIPRQGGSDHVNEHWQSWWAERFAEHGFLPVDCVRRRIWTNPDVEWWYAQNTVVYATRDQLARNARLKTEYEQMGAGQLSIVHPACYLRRRQRLREAFAPTGRPSVPSD